jgi:hypothetical protein
MRIAPVMLSEAKHLVRSFSWCILAYSKILRWSQLCPGSIQVNLLRMTKDSSVEQVSRMVLR